MLVAVQILVDAGLEFASTKRQVENGTLLFNDPKLKKVQYSITANGYARRHVTGPSYFNTERENHYPLNKAKTPAERKAGSPYDASVHLSPGDYEGLAKIILNRFVKYREKNPNLSNSPAGKSDKRASENRAKSVEDFDLPAWVNEPNGDADKVAMREFAGMIKDALDYAGLAQLDYNTIVDLVDQGLADLKEEYKY